VTRAVAICIGCVVLGTVVSLAAGPDGFGLPSGDLLELRASRTALALVVGAALSAVGAALQALLRNPLADPFVLGVSGGAALGAAIAQAAVVTLAVSSAVVGLGAIGGAAAASALVLWFVRRDGGGSRDGVTGGAVLIGVVVNAFSWAVVSTVRVALPASEAQGLSTWLIGALTYPSTPALLVAAVVVVCGVVALAAQGPALVLLQGGDDDARRLGVPVERTGLIVVTGATILTGVAVAVTGVIGFIGLLVPHAVRRLLGVDVGAAVWASALCGAGLLAALDGLARAAFAVWGTELPVGAVCALVGAPALAVVLARARP